MLILVVEDHKIMLKFYQWYFKATGIDIHCECSVAGALKVLTEKQFDAVITDRLLKSGDDESSQGEEVVEAVRQLQPGLPVIMVSDREGPTAADGFISKRDPDFPGCLIGKIIEASKRQVARAIIGRVCHEVNNQAMVVLGLADSALETLPNAPINSLEETFQSLVGAVHRLGDFTTALARLQTFQFVRSLGNLVMIKIPELTKPELDQS